MSESLKATTCINGSKLKEKNRESILTDDANNHDQEQDSGAWSRGSNLVANDVLWQTVASRVPPVTPTLIGRLSSETEGS